MTERNAPSRVLLTAVLGLVALGSVIYLQTAGFQFINLDDDLYVTKNPRVLGGLSWDNLRWAFTATEAGNWHPLTWVSHLVDTSVFGPGPAGPHLVNVLLHAVNAILLFLLLGRLSGEWWAGAMVAALFMVHPLHVESVAWVSERKDVLSGCLLLLTMLLYLRYVNKPTGVRLLAVSGQLSLALMAKPMAVTLPFVLLLLDWWPLGRWGGNGRAAGKAGLSVIVAEKIPLLMLSAASGLVTLYAQNRAGAIESFQVYPLGARTANALVAYGTYLVKAFWPTRLAPFYPHPASGHGGAAVAAVAILLALTAAAIVLRRRHPYLAVGWFWYVGMLVPVIGIVQVGSQAMADRYTYLPLVGIFIMVAWGVRDVTGPRRSLGPFPALLVMAAVLALTAVSWFQVGRWRNDIILFSHALNVTRDNWLAANNLGQALADAGKREAAVELFREAIRLMPGYFDPRANLAYALLALGRTDEAVGPAEEALRLRPSTPELRYRLGVALAAEGKTAPAAEQFRREVAAHPENIDARFNLGVALVKLGLRAEAMEAYAEVLRRHPGDYAAHFNLGLLLLQDRRFAEAESHFTAAAGLQPAEAAALLCLGASLEGQGRQGEAAERYRQVLAVDPGNIEARRCLDRGRRGH